MELPLREIRRNEVLLYLGYRGGEIPPEVEADIARCSRELLDTARPRVTWRLFDLEEDGRFAGTAFTPGGQDVRELLRDCRQAILLAATLGAEADKLIQRRQITDMGDAVILDCCANSAIEVVCDDLCDQLASQFAPMHLTDRFSPGYGDMPLSQQPEFCTVLNTARTMGLAVSRSGLLTPLKSVTAIVGLADKPQTRRFSGCAVCSNFENCSFRKENRTCGN
jgi:hypothetical protein